MGVVLETGKSRADYPRGCIEELSDDGKKWGKPVAKGNVGASNGGIRFPATKARVIRITQTGKAEGKLFWSIHEIKLLTPSPSVSAC